jgi:hypothetical protein
MSSVSEPVLLVRVFDPVEAEIIVAKLRGAGITSFVRHEAAGAVYGLTVDGWGQQDIIVRASDLQEARMVLEGPEASEAPDDGEADDGAPDGGSSDGMDTDGAAPDSEE